MPAQNACQRLHGVSLPAPDSDAFDDPDRKLVAQGLTRGSIIAAWLPDSAPTDQTKWNVPLLLAVEAERRSLVADQGEPFRSGSCICRGVTFRVTGEPLRVGICHSTECRKASGSTFSAFAVWPLEAFEQTTGFTGTYAGRSFCLTCGGRVTSIREDEVEVMIGSLDEAPSDLTPEYELWIGRRESWLNPLPFATQFEEDREDPRNDAEVEPPEQPEPEVATERKPPV